MTEAAVADDDEERSGKRGFTRELWFLGVVAIVLALTLKTFLIQAFFIPSPSMEKTLHGCEGCQGDRVLVNKVVYKFRDIHRGEIVVFNGKGTNFQPETTITPPENDVQRVLWTIQRVVGLGAPGERDFIKRVIGVPGDVVACCTDGKVTINGQPLDEPYVNLTGGGQQATFQPVTVPPGHLWLMGDNRDNSLDSRANGPVPQDRVVGRAFAVFFPLNRAKVLRVPPPFDPEALGVAAPPGTPTGLPDVLGLAVPVVARRLRRSTD